MLTYMTRAVVLQLSWAVCRAAALHPTYTYAVWHLRHPAETL